MKTQILITSFLPDRQWLEFNLRSIEKFATGFDRVVVVIPKHDYGHFLSLSQKYGFTIHLRPCASDTVEDHNLHQVAKLSADQYCRGADLVLHTDSDCIFTEPVKPEDYLRDGKPELLTADFHHVGAAICWKAGVDHALGIDAKRETMRRHPAVHYIGVYPELRQHMQLRHNMTLEQYFLRPGAKKDRPSEFNILGNFVLMKPQWREKYHVIDLGREPAPPSSKKLIQFWSPSPPDKPQKSPNDGTLYTPADFVNKLLGK